MCQHEELFFVVRDDVSIRRKWLTVHCCQKPLKIICRGKHKINLSCKNVCHI
jgi:hypothetical protein